MEKIVRNKRAHKRTMYTIIAAILLMAVFFLMLGYVYKNAEVDALDDLHLVTREIKEEINIQMISDRENLMTMASLAASLYERDGNFDLLFESFEPIGLIEYIGILTPDNMFLKKDGAYNAEGKLSFMSDAIKGEYVSGLVKTVSLPDRTVVRSAVPVVSNGETIAMLYGVTELSTFAEKYSGKVQDAYIYLIDGNGNFVLNSLGDESDNIKDFSVYEFIDGYSYAELYHNVLEHHEGNSAFKNPDGENTYYSHYSSLSLGKWKIMLLKSEADIYASVRDMTKNLLSLFLICIFITSVHLFVILKDERNESGISITASRTRKLLLEINQQSGSFKEALYELTKFAKSRSAFFVDNDGEDYNYISPEFESVALNEEEQEEFISLLMNYADEFRKKGTMVYPKAIRRNKGLKGEFPELYDYMENHGLDRVCIAMVADKTDTISILGVVNPGIKLKVSELLKEVAVCFSIAMRNKKYLHKTEMEASTDALTGLANRMSFNNDIAEAQKNSETKYTAIYIDANELHILNHKSGHEAGDMMLKTIAEVFSEIFKGNRVYRIGGDEFFVLAKNLSLEEIGAKISECKERLEEDDYHISVGIAECTDELPVEKAVKKAEKSMYSEKAAYYQSKGDKFNLKSYKLGIERIATGVDELDSFLKAISRRYTGVLYVDIANDKVREIVGPEYLKKFVDSSGTFSKTFYNYIIEAVQSDYYRTLLGFTYYSSWEKLRESGEEIHVPYKKIDGSEMLLTIYPVSESETIWTFENAE